MTVNPLIAQAVAQGHGPTVTDPAVIARIRRIIRTATRKVVA